MAWLQHWLAVKIQLDSKHLLWTLFLTLLYFSKVQKDFFHRREWNFTLKDDIFIRYITFNDSTEFEKDLLKRLPFKIDIGGVYNTIVSDLFF
jgi:DNA primase catalytic subunit